VRRLRFRTPASSDLRQIANQTRQRWDADQAARYVDRLRGDIKSLAEFALRFPLLEDTRLSLRKMPSGHHLVFYLVTETEVEIVRVLHEGMEARHGLDRGSFVTGDES
jgi:toxin ParE1/3/4